MFCCFVKYLTACSALLLTHKIQTFSCNVLLDWIYKNCQNSKQSRVTTYISLLLYFILRLFQLLTKQNKSFQPVTNSTHIMYYNCTYILYWWYLYTNTAQLQYIEHKNMDWGWGRASTISIHMKPKYKSSQKKLIKFGCIVLCTWHHIYIYI